MKIRSLAAAARGVGRAAGRHGARHRPRGHALVDLRRRGGGGRRVRQGLRRHRQQLGRRRDRRLRHDRAADHDQPHHRRRPDGRHPVQPRPPGRGAGRGRADARPRPTSPTAENWADGRQPAVAARELHARRQDLLRAGQHPLLAVALAVEQGLRGRRRAGADQLGRVRRRRAGAARRPARCRSPSASSPGRQSGAFNVLLLALGGKDLYLKVYERQGRRGRPAGPEMAKIFEGRRRRPQDGARARTCRTGTRRPTWSSPTRPAARSWATGRRASSRSRARSPARTTPACPASACNDDHLAPTATPSTSRCSTTRRSRRRRRCSPR